MIPRNPPNPRVMVALGLLFLPGCGGAGGGADSESPAANPDQSMAAAMLDENAVRFRPAAQEVPLKELGFDYGSEDAPIRVVELSDYGCGYCRLFHTETFPALLKDHIETGRVHWKYVTFVSGMFPNGMSAAFAAECAGEQDRFPRFNDLLYERQSDWKNLGDPLPVYDELARAAGADIEELHACIEEERPRARVQSGIVMGRNLGLRGTPAFLVNGIPVMGAQPLEWWVEFFATIEEAIAELEAGDGGAPGREPPP